MSDFEWQEFVRVDEVVECWPINRAVERELLAAMPDAYGGTPPGEDAWPEPDRVADRPYKLARCWEKLPEEVRQALTIVRDLWDDRMSGKFGFAEYESRSKAICDQLVK